MTPYEILANHLIANFRHGEFNIFHLREFARVQGRGQREVTKSLKLLAFNNFLTVTGKTKLPQEKVWRITYQIKMPEFESYAEFQNREQYLDSPRISQPRPYLIVHRMLG